MRLGLEKDNGRIVIRPHQVPAFVELIDGGRVTDQLRQKYGDVMSQVFQGFINTIGANPETPIFIDLNENTICRSECANLAQSRFDISRSAVVIGEVSEAVRYFGKNASKKSGYTIDELRAIVYK